MNNCQELVRSSRNTPREKRGKLWLVWTLANTGKPFVIEHFCCCWFVPETRPFKSIPSGRFECSTWIQLHFATMSIPLNICNMCFVRRFDSCMDCVGKMVPLSDYSRFMQIYNRNNRIINVFCYGQVQAQGLREERTRHLCYSHKQTKISPWEEYVRSSLSKQVQGRSALAVDCRCTKRIWYSVICVPHFTSMVTMHLGSTSSSGNLMQPACIAAVR